MMKLSVEIKDEKFIYEYDFGEGGRAHGEMPVTPDNLTTFTSILNVCSRQDHADFQKTRDEISAKAWIERHTEEAQKFIKERLKK